jgi:large subunit ribosomal protein L2
MWCPKTFLNKLRLPGFVKKSGRSRNGAICVNSRGSGLGMVKRIVDLTRNILFIPARICSIERDSSRTAFISLICYSNGILSYILSAENNWVGKFVYSLRTIPTTRKKLLSFITFKSFFVKSGNFIPIRLLKAGSEVSAVTSSVLSKSIFSRAAGTKCRVLRPNVVGRFCVLRLPSGNIQVLSSSSFGVFGRMSNMTHKLLKLNKAGDNRLKGWRPHVRGVAKNPVDHPHGGGEGKTSGGRSSVTPWGVLTKGYKTVPKKLRLQRKVLISKLNKL